MAPPRRRHRTLTGKTSPAQILTILGGCLLALLIILVGLSWLSGTGTKSPPTQVASQGKTLPGTQKPVQSVIPEVAGAPYFRSPTRVANLGPARASSAPMAQSSGLSLKEEMEEVLFNLRKAQLEKDMDLFMSCYSPSFPDLEKKRQDTLKIWHHNEFVQMVFDIGDIQEVATGNDLASVTWEVQVRNLETQKITSSSQKFKVWFVKEKGRLLIKSMEKEELKKEEGA